MKGQAAIEYMTVFGMALVLAAPFVVEAQNSLVEIRSSTSMLSAQDSLNDMDVAIRTVSAAGEPAARTFEVRLPDNLNRTEVRDRSIIIVLDSPSGTVDLSRSFQVDLDGSLPDESGLYLVKTQAVNGTVNIEVIS